VARGWKRLNNEELHNLYASPNIIRVARHVARKGGMRNAYSILVEKPKEKDHLEDLGVGGRILERILRKEGG
jgi:hypothetical protein